MVLGSNNYALTFLTGFRQDPLLGKSRYACGRVDAQDVKYTTSMKTGWKPPLRYRLMPEEERQKLRDMFRIVIDGHGVPPPIPSFQVRASSGRRCTGNT